MARYGDLDALEKKLFPIGMVDDGRYALPAKAVKVAIDRLPTADVVPRAEVYELIKKLECLLCHATGGLLSKHTYDLHTMERAVTDQFCKQYEEGLAEGYKCTSEEIFAEINAIKKEYASGDIDGNELFVRLYMLEKKYTEGE